MARKVLLRFGPFETDVCQIDHVHGAHWDTGELTLHLPPIYQRDVDAAHKRMAGAVGMINTFALFFPDGTVMRCQSVQLRSWNYSVGESQTVTVKFMSTREKMSRGGELRARFRSRGADNADPVAC